MLSDILKKQSVSNKFLLVLIKLLLKFKPDRCRLKESARIFMCSLRFSVLFYIFEVYFNTKVEFLPERLFFKKLSY